MASVDPTELPCPHQGCPMRLGLHILALDTDPLGREHDLGWAALPFKSSEGERSLTLWERTQRWQPWWQCWWCPQRGCHLGQRDWRKWQKKLVRSLRGGCCGLWPSKERPVWSHPSCDLKVFLSGSLPGSCWQESSSRHSRWWTATTTTNTDNICWRRPQAAHWPALTHFI